MKPLQTDTPLIDRRSWLTRTSDGLMSAALLGLLGSPVSPSQSSASEQASTSSALQAHLPAPHHPPTANSVIQLFMNGGPSQMDLFDPKEELTKNHGKSYFNRIAGEVENPQDAGALMRSPFRFAQHGECGMWVSDAMPHLAQCVDDIALIRSMHAPNLTHEPALFKVHSGSELPGHPSLGSWITYGLGSENQNLPAYVVLDDPRGMPVNRSQSWQAGFLPPSVQGTRFRATGSPVLNLQRDFTLPERVADLEQQLRLKLDQAHLGARPREPRLEARLKAYELAARMQLSATDALDLRRESAEVLEAYGVGREPTDSYGRRCLYARRLVERGVRFVQLFIDFQIWDNHTDLAAGLKGACERTDQPIAALLKDLKQRGLLDSTLVIWGGEFGRLPIAQLPGDKNEAKAGRDHNKNAMVTWFAGGGVKGGLTYGATDEIGLAAVENRVSIEDWHATLLHLVGLDHHQLSFHRNGLEERLTGVSKPRVIKELFA